MIVCRLSIASWRSFLEAEAVHHKCFVPPRCIPLFLRLLNISSDRYGLGEIKYWNTPRSSGRLFDVSTLWCTHWTSPYVPKGWSLWTPSWSQQFSALLLVRILSPFPMVWSIGQGVLWGRREPTTFTEFSSQSILSIFPYLEKRWCSMVSAENCPNPVSCSTSEDRKTGSTALMICFLKDLSMVVYFRNSAWFFWNFSVPSACSWAFPMVGG